MPTFEPHPLDTDLLDYVEDRSDERTRELIEDHLRGCPLCRIKRQRLTGAPPITISDLREVAAPEFEILDVEDSAGVSARSGELWLTASEDAMMVLVKTVRSIGSGVVVVPVTLDVEVADSGALILDEHASPIGVPIAVYDRLVTSLPTDALATRVVPLRPGVDFTANAEGTPGITRGTRLEGPDDPRHEVRQDLLDRLSSLEPYGPEEDGIGGTEEADPRIDLLREELHYRGSQCEVEELGSLPTLEDSPPGWRPIALVRDFYILIALIETPRRLTLDSEFVAAQVIVTKLGGSALIFCPTGAEEVELFDVPTLFDASELPGGGRNRTPIFSRLSLSDSVVKFLDQKRTMIEWSGSTRQAGPRLDVASILEEKVRGAVAATSGRGRLQQPKKDGYRNLDQLSDQLAHVLRSALEGNFDPRTVADLVEGTDR